MLKRLRRERKLVFSFVLFFLLLLSVSKTSKSVEAIESSTINPSKFKKLDLQLSEEIFISEVYFQRTFFLEKEWDLLVLNLTVQNLGDPFNGVVLQVHIDDNIISYRYNALEQIGLVKAYSYQFELHQNLILPLNYSGSGIKQIEIRIILDHVPSVILPNVNFSIVQGEILAFDYLQPTNNMQLPISSSNYQYLIQPANLVFLQKKLCLTTYLFCQIPSGMQLDSTISVVIDRVGIDQIQINGESFHGVSGNPVIFNLTIPANNGFSRLDFTIYPSYKQVHENTKLKLFVSISGNLSQNTNSQSEGELGPPIPWWLMYPIILVGLFGFPYYNVYKEHLISRKEEILDPKRNVKLK
ncbi:MAG: hypothetical protein ACXACU_10945 [Candidatus Hodarchaeales archaeon]|jgi:hypothetical protein